MDPDTREMLGHFAQRIVDEGLSIEDTAQQLKRAAQARSIMRDSDTQGTIMALKDHEARLNQLEERLESTQLALQRLERIEHYRAN